MSGQGDLVERLRVYGVGLTCGPDGCLFPDELLDEAAEEIERLRAEWLAMVEHIEGGCIDQSLTELCETARSTLANSPPAKAPE